MNATTIMDPNPTVLKPTDMIKTAIGYIMEHRYRNLPVIDDEGRYLGSFGVNCLLKNVLPKAAMMKQGLENVSFVQETLADLHNRLIELDLGAPWELRNFCGSSRFGSCRAYGHLLYSSVLRPTAGRG